jgi:hydroxymethylpyrimidine pyrophosphatase-like HAD family hydrolase
METLGRAHLSIRADYLVLVEREIYYHEDSRYLSSEPWNQQCSQAHARLFERINADVPRLVEWVKSRFSATLYADAYSPFCLIADHNENADVIYDYLASYAKNVPDLAIVRNDVYARFSHVAYNKGIALAEITRQLGLKKDQVLVAGDHYNDLPMLSREYARWIVGPANAIPTVKAAILASDGFVSEFPWGHGVADGLELCLGQALLPA